VGLCKEVGASPTRCAARPFFPVGCSPEITPREEVDGDGSFKSHLRPPLTGIAGDP